MAITYNDRKTIEKCLKEGIPITKIASLIGCSRATIYNEMQRGKVVIVRDGVNDSIYSADIAQERYELVRKKSLLDSSKVYQANVESISEMLRYGKSVKEIADSLNIASKTIYNYINNGSIPGYNKQDHMQREIKMFNQGSIVIPKWIREKLKISDGQHFQIELDENEIKLIPIQKEDI